MKRKHEETINSERQELLARIKRGEEGAFQPAPEHMRDDFDVVLAAVRESGYCLEYASPRLRGDRVIVMAAVNECGYTLEYASLELRGIRDIVMTAVRREGWALRSASSELRADREVVLAAVVNYPWALRYASDDLRADEDIVIAAVRTWPSPFEYAASTLRRNIRFIARVIHATSVGNKHPLYFTKSIVKEAIQDVCMQFNTFPETRDFFQGSIQIRNAFLEFLCCVTSESASAADNPATMLHLDKITSEKLHRHIAEYAGVPLGQRLESVRLVKLVMPIMAVVFENRGDEQSLDLLLELSGISQPDSDSDGYGYYDESDDY